MKDWLDSPSGHISVSVVVIILGAVFLKLGIAKGDDMIVAGSALLGRCMLGANGRYSTPKPEVPKS
jgi:hypothetical protein